MKRKGRGSRKRNENRKERKIVYNDNSPRNVAFFSKAMIRLQDLDLLFTQGMRTHSATQGFSASALLRLLHRQIKQNSKTDKRNAPLKHKLFLETKYIPRRVWGIFLSGRGTRHPPSPSPSHPPTAQHPSGNGFPVAILLLAAAFCLAWHISCCRVRHTRPGMFSNTLIVYPIPESPGHLISRRFKRRKGERG